MKSRFLTLVCLLIAGIAFSQRSATLSQNSDLKSIHDGLITTSFTLSSDLGEDETASLESWVKGNASLFTVKHSGREITVITNTTYNDRNVYTKLFGILGVESVLVKENGSEHSMNTEEFFAHFGL